MLFFKLNKYLPGIFYTLDNFPDSWEYNNKICEESSKSSHKTHIIFNSTCHELVEVLLSKTPCLYGTWRNQWRAMQAITVPVTSPSLALIQLAQVTDSDYDKEKSHRREAWQMRSSPYDVPVGPSYSGIEPQAVLIRRGILCNLLSLQSKTTSIIIPNQKMTFVFLIPNESI